MVKDMWDRLEESSYSADKTLQILKMFILIQEKKIHK